MHELAMASHAKPKCIVGGSASNCGDDVITSSSTPATVTRTYDVIAIVTICQQTYDIVYYDL
jgi:hypothetical protein